jgi:cell filamentation protein
MSCVNHLRGRKHRKLNEWEIENIYPFYNDREVRAVWDDEHAKWYFSVLDIVGVLNEETDYNKTRNYWKYLKARLKKENNQLVSATTQLKLTAADGKKYNSDMYDSLGVIAFAKHFPNTKALKFLG